MTPTGQQAPNSPVLDLYDEVMEMGKNLPLSELKAKYDSTTGRNAFRYDYRHNPTAQIATLPLEEFAIGRFGAIDVIADAIRGLYGEDNVIVTVESGSVIISRWASEENLREMWPTYAEAEYQIQAQPS